MSNFTALLQEFESLVSLLESIMSGQDDLDVVLPNGKVKGSLEKRIKEQFSHIKAAVSGQIPFETRVLMDADLNYDQGVSARVWNDSTESNNGLYEKLGASGSGSWQKSKYDNYDELKSNVSALDSAQRALDGKINYGMARQGVEATDNQVIAVSEGPIPADEKMIAVFSDDNGYSPLLISEIGQIIIPMLKALNLNVNDDIIESLKNVNYAWSVEDENKNVALAIDAITGDVWAGVLKLFGVLKLGESAEVVHGEYNYDFVLVDGSGNAAFGVLEGKLISGDASEAVDVRARDQSNLAYSNQVKQFINTSSARHEFDYNHIAVYGQSLSTGHEGWPALSKTPMYGNLMLGDCVRPNTTEGDSFVPFGGNALKPLVSNVQQGTRILTDGEVALLEPGNGSLGEVVNFGMVNFAKKLFNRTRAVVNDDARSFVTTNNGVSGRTIEQLSKNNPQDNTLRYQRYSDSLSIIKGIADADGKTYGVTACVWMQGEYNYADAWNGESTYLGYKAKLKQLRDDQVSDAKAVSGQADDPIFITYQTGAAYTRDVDENGDSGLHVGMAQWDFAKENENCFLAGPIYPYTDKGGHLDSNGYRWYGNMLGKIYHKIVTLGQDWKPLSPIRTELIGSDVYIDFHVPEPPLVFDNPFNVLTPTDYIAKGFRVTDDLGDNTVTGAELVGDTIVKLSLRRALKGAGFVWYADKTKHNGNGNLRDSDSIVAHDKYEFKPSEGMYESANIPELVNKPYPLHNWCIAFHVPINWESK